MAPTPLVFLVIMYFGILYVTANYQDSKEENRILYEFTVETQNATVHFGDLCGTCAYQENANATSKFYLRIIHEDDWDIGFIITCNQLCATSYQHFLYTAFAQWIENIEDYKKSDLNLPFCSLGCKATKITEGLDVFTEIDAQQKVIKCMMPVCGNYLIKANIVFSTELEDLATQLSYGAFARKLNEIIGGVRKQFHDFRFSSSTKMFYIRIILNQRTGIHNSKMDLARKYCQEFAKKWLASNKNVTIILENFKDQEFPNQPLSNFVLPRIDEMKSFNNMIFTRELPEMLASVHRNFQNFYLEIGKQFETQTCQNISYAKTLSANFPFIHLFGEEAHPKVFQNCPVNVIFYNNAIYWNNFDNNLVELTNSTSNTNVPVSCFIPNSNFSTIAVRNITTVYLFNQTQEQFLDEGLLELLEDLTGYHFDFRSLQDYLTTITNYQYDLLQIEPNPQAVTFLLVFRLRDSVRRQHKDLSESGGYSNYFSLNLFCSSYHQQVREFGEAIVRWARIHNFQVSPYTFVDMENYMGYWYDVITSSEINRTITKFPVLVRRNMPEVFQEEISSSYTYPCIYANNNKYIEYIKLTNTLYSGISVTFDLPERTVLMNVKEIAVFLKITFSRFSLVEAQMHNNKMFLQLAEPWTDLMMFSGLFIEAECTTLSSFLDVFQNVRILPTGIHLYNWEKVSSEKLPKNLIRFTHLTFGITIKNCIKEINEGLLRVIEFIRSAGNISYVVCVMKGFLIHQYEEKSLQEYLDTQLYIQKYFNFTLNVDTIFRIEFDTTCMFIDDSEAYIRFLNATIQYAEGYKIKYFLGNAFVNCSWWKVENYTNLLNFTSYTERVTGQPVLESLLDMPSKTEERNNNKQIVVTVGLVLCSLLLLIFAIISISMYYRRKIRRILTEEEEKEFRQGVASETESLQPAEGDTGLEIYQSLGFNSEFEIAKRHIRLGHILGNGNFGQVFQGTLNGDKPVAIKIPAAGCSKEAFKTMISEVKVQSHLGCHENVVRFLGAYTMEIDVGLIYIVTEFCEKGMLQTYLQSLKPKVNYCESIVHSNASSESEESDDDDEVYKAAGTPQQNYVELFVNNTELCRFAKEIASGMDYIAQKRVVHADLSTRNVLLNSNYTCKIADFGLSKEMFETKDYIRHGEVGLPWKWLAIETLREKKFTTQSDIWGYGVTLWEIFSLGAMPWPGKSLDINFVKRLEKGKRLAKPEHASDEIYQQMLLCWSVEPGQRPSFSELKDFFANQEFDNEPEANILSDYVLHL